MEIKYKTEGHLKRSGMDPNKLVVGKRYLMFHYEAEFLRGIKYPAFWSVIYEYTGSSSNYPFGKLVWSHTNNKFEFGDAEVFDVEGFKIISDPDKSNIGSVVAFGHNEIRNWMDPYSNNLFGYYSLFQV